jgi:hypothetical protein
MATTVQAVKVSQTTFSRNASSFFPDVRSSRKTMRWHSVKRSCNPKHACLPGKWITQICTLHFDTREQNIFQRMLLKFLIFIEKGFAVHECYGKLISSDAHSISCLRREDKPNRIFPISRKEYLCRRQAIRMRYREELAVLEQQWRYSRQGRTVRKSGEVLEAVRGVICFLPDGFTYTEVRRMLREVRPGLANRIGRTSISSALARLAKRGEIEVIERGTGRSPSRFAKRDNAPSQ